MAIATKDDFANHIKEIQAKDGYKSPLAFGIARVDKGQLDNSKVLQATYATLNWDRNLGSGAVFLDALEKSGQKVDFSDSEAVCEVTEDFLINSLESFAPYVAEATNKEHQNVQIVKILANLFENAKKENAKTDMYKIVFLFEDTNPKSVESVYLKLTAISQAQVELRSICLDGAFGVLPNVAWSGNIPVELDWLREFEMELKLSGSYPLIDSVDKFPRYLGHIIPADNTRILDSSKVRFGAQLAPGTTVMPGASYINFNAGTLGAVMVEGRISSSAIVGAGSDVGGGASILGVLSGTDGNPISIGENTLLGANSTTGIPLGDGCIIDGGVAIFAGTKVYISSEDASKLNEINSDANLKEGVVKAQDLQSLNGLHFRSDSQSGQIVVKRSTKEVKLNSDLH